MDENVDQVELTELDEIIAYVVNVLGGVLTSVEYFDDVPEGETDADNAAE